MSDSSVNPSSGNVPGGGTYARTGWLFWTSNEDGSNRSTVIAWICSSGINDRNGNPLPSENIHLVNRFGDYASFEVYNTPQWGTPFTESGQGRGSDVKQFMLSAGAGGNKRAYNLIKQVWSEEEAIKWAQRERVLVFEPVYWNMVYENGKGTGIWQCGTANFFGQYQAANNINADGIGDKWIRKYTNNLYAHCVQFEVGIDSIGITAGSQSGVVSNIEMGKIGIGYGIGVVWNDDDSIHSYWAPNGSPGKPEPADPPKNGACNIVKSYYEEDLSTGSKVDLGTFYTANCTNSIIVDDEPLFEMVGWKISSTTNFGINSLSWSPPSAVTRTGTQPAAVKLINAEKTVYILLV